MVEALDDHTVEDPDDVRRYYTTLLREIERLTVMIDDLLLLAQIDAGVLVLQKRRTALSRVVAEVVDAMHAQAQRAGVTLMSQVAGASTAVVIDTVQIRRAMITFVRNALQHTPVGGQVVVATAATEGWVTLRVTGSGAGIDPTTVPHIWRRLDHDTQPRGLDATSLRIAGLGLTVARGVVEAHGGFVAVSSRPGTGASFTMHLPQR